MNKPKINPNCKNELPDCMECEYVLSCRQEFPLEPEEEEEIPEGELS